MMKLFQSWCEAGTVFLLSTVMATTVYANDAVIGSLDVNVSVNQGSLSATIPFDFPSGIHDLTPSLGLQYSQQGGNGIVGPGFELAGTASISLCTPNINIDGFYSGLDGSIENARFCLNGQRLVLSNGVHGRSGATYIFERNNNSSFGVEI